MGRILQERFTSWPEGVNTSAEKDQIPPTASPRGLNTALTSISSGEVVVQKRRGMSVMNATAVTGTPQIWGQKEFSYLASTGAFTRYHLLVSDGGRVDLLAVGGSLSNISTGLTAGDLIPDFATANNLEFIVNGTDAKKIVLEGGTPTLRPFGITRPTVATMAGAAGAAGSPSGTYELRVSYYNSNTGHESSISDTATATVTVTSQKIDWTAVPVSSDAQVTHRYLYVRNTSTMPKFYRAGTIADNSTTTATTDFTDASLVTGAPDTEENNPPATGIRYLAWHKSRLFAATDSTLYYSKVSLPEAFDPDAAEPINPNDGQKITGLLSVFGVLLILKSNSCYVLVGDDPNTWSIELVDPAVGGTSHRSLAVAEGVAYWWSEQGPVAWTYGSQPVPIGTPLIAPTLRSDNLNFAQLSIVAAAVDQTNFRVMFGVPEASQTVLTMVLPFNYRLKRWDSTKWDPMRFASFGVAQDTNGIPWVFLGNNLGQVFKWWNADNDGVASGTVTGTFTASGTSVSTITDAGAAFDTTGAKLAERVVTIYNSSGTAVGTRQRISSNTATALTLAAAISGVVDGETYTYVVGGPFFEFDTKWSDMGDSFTKKRFEFLYLQAESVVDRTTAGSGATTIYADIGFNRDDTSGQKTVSLSGSNPGATWDVSLWDVGVFGSAVSLNQRKRIGQTGWSYRVRLRNYAANAPLTIYKIGVRAEALTSKLG